jgi:hypothetical protein
MNMYSYIYIPRSEPHIYHSVTFAHCLGQFGWCDIPHTDFPSERCIKVSRLRKCHASEKQQKVCWVRVLVALEYRCAPIGKSRYSRETRLPGDEASGRWGSGTTRPHFPIRFSTYDDAEVRRLSVYHETLIDQDGGSGSIRTERLHP